MSQSEDPPSRQQLMAFLEQQQQRIDALEDLVADRTNPDPRPLASLASNINRRQALGLGAGALALLGGGAQPALGGHESVGDDPFYGLAWVTDDDAEPPDPDEFGLDDDDITHHLFSPNTAFVPHFRQSGDAGWTQLGIGSAAKPVLSVTTEELSIISSDVTFTVGVGGDFSTINDALATISRKRTEFKSDGVRVTLNLLSGFTMSEQVFVEDGLDLSWIRITSDDAEVTIDRSALTEGFFTYHSERFPAFGAKNGAILPVIDALFNMDSSGTAAERDGIFLTQQSAVQVTRNGGVKNAGGRGLYALRGCLVNCETGEFANAGATFSGSGEDNIVSLHNNVLNIQKVDATGAGRRGVFINGCSTVNARDIDVSNATDEGIRAHRGASIDAYQATVNGCGADGVYAENACRVNLDSATINDAGASAIDARWGSIVSARNINIDNGGGFDTVIVQGGYITLRDGSVTNSTGHAIAAGGGGVVSARAVTVTGTSDNDYRVDRGGIIATDGTGKTLNQTGNSVTADGIIFVAETLQNGGETTVDDGGTIAHGLDSTPNIYFVESRDSGVDARVTGVDATNLTVEATNEGDGASAGTGVNVVWEAKVR